MTSIPWISNGYHLVLIIDGGCRKIVVVYGMHIVFLFVLETSCKLIAKPVVKSIRNVLVVVNTAEDDQGDREEHFHSTDDVGAVLNILKFNLRVIDGVAVDDSETACGDKGEFHNFKEQCWKNNKTYF